MGDNVHFKSGCCLKENYLLVTSQTLMWNSFKLLIIPWIYFVDVPFHWQSLLFCVPQCKITNKRTKQLTSKYTPPPPPPLSDLWSCTLPWELDEHSNYFYKKSCGSQLFQDAWDVVCAENYWWLKSFKAEKQQKYETGAAWSFLSYLFSQGGKGSAWLWSYSLPSTCFCMHVHAASCLKTWLSSLVFLEYLPFEENL